MGKKFNQSWLAPHKNRKHPRNKIRAEHKNFSFECGMLVIRDYRKWKSKTPQAVRSRCTISSMYLLYIVIASTAFFWVDEWANEIYRLCSLSCISSIFHVNLLVLTKVKSNTSNKNNEWSHKYHINATKLRFPKKRWTKTWNTSCSRLFCISSRQRSLQKYQIIRTVWFDSAHY